MTLHKTIISRKEIAKKFTQKFIDQVKKDLQAYYNENPGIVDLLGMENPEINSIRYFFPVHLIQQYHDSIMSSTFDRAPDLIFKAKGKFDSEKETKITAAYEYLKDKLNLNSFLIDSAWWFFLSGFVSNTVEYKTEYREVPIIDETTGLQEVGDDGKMLTRPEYLYDDPVLEIDDPEKTYFSPDSKFSNDGKKIQYRVAEVLMTKEDVYEAFGKSVEPDSRVDFEASSDEAKKDLDRVTVFIYRGTVPKENKNEVKDWNSRSAYYIAVTAKETLHKEKLDDYDLGCSLGKWKGVPKNLFGHGLGMLLSSLQREKSIRRGQAVRMGDVSAFPKMAVKNEDGNDIDIKAISDPRDSTVLLYTTEPPQYLTPPPVSETIIKLDQSADIQAQQETGLMDVGGGSQTTNTVDTATGQTIFADAAAKRITMGKNQLMAYYKATVIKLLKKCQQNWNEDKLMSIMDLNGQNQEVVVGREDLKDVDFDKDIDIDVESTTVNKDVLRSQSISMYDKTKDDPIVDRPKVFKEMMSKGFQVPNPEEFIKQNSLTPGMTLVGNDGSQYVVDESGSVVPSQDMQELANPSSDQPISTQPNVV